MAKKETAVEAYKRIRAENRDTPSKKAPAKKSTPAKPMSLRQKAAARKRALDGY